MIARQDKLIGLLLSAMPLQHPMLANLCHQDSRINTHVLILRCCAMLNICSDKHKVMMLPQTAGLIS